MRFILAIFLLVFTPLAATAQDTTARDRGILQAFIEDNLSSEGTKVRIEGFAGALSSQATLDQLTIADDQGVWLTLRGVVLNWSRTALLSGRLEVDELSAKEILLPRLPAGQAGPKVPSAEAKPFQFQLPDLPVSVNIGKISAETVDLGAPVLGVAAKFTLEGNLSLADGVGKAALDITRTDGVEGKFSLAAEYANADDALKLDLSLTEGAGGIVGTLLSLPGRPPLSLTVAGSGPLSDFQADIALSSDGQPRLSGQVRLTEDAGADGAPATRRFAGELSGDIAPLFAPDLRPFFGPEIRLAFGGNRASDGRLELSNLSLNAAALKLQGSLTVGADGLPERFDLTGRIEGDGPVLLPLSGPETRVNRADISAQFDAARGEEWTARAEVTGLERAGLRLGAARVDGTGTISRAQPRSVTADLAVSASGIAPDDAALAAALGDRLDGRVTIAFQNGQPMRVSGLDVTGAGLHLTADGTVQGFTGGYPVQGKARLVSDDISRFAGLAGRPLSGAADIAVSGSGALLGGAFDIDLQAVTTDLETGQARIDPLLTGQSTLALKARRDTTGTTLRDFTLKNAALSADASGAIDSQAGNLTLSARLAELSLVEPSLSGPATLDTNATWTAGKPVQVQSLTVAGAGAQLKASGTLDPSDDTLPITGKADLSMKDLAPFSTLARRPLRGALSLSASGSGAVKGRDFDVTLSASGQDLGAGLGDIDKLIAGQSTLTLDAARKDGRIRITDFALETPQLTAQAAGGLDETRKLDFSAKLADLGVLVPDFPGPLTATGNARADGADWQVALDATGPGGTTARVEGRVAGSGKDVNLSLTGAAPLGLANSFIAPRSIRGSARYDLRMNGAPGLAALSGTVSANGAQIAAPTLGVALNGVDATAQLSGGRADLSVAARVEGGGQVSVEGPVSLSPPFDAGLRVTLNNAAFRDPELYQTRVSGDISLQGPLRGAGQVTGTLELGTTEIQVPSAGAAPGGLVPDGIIHLNEPAAVRATRARAGINGGPGDGGAQTSAGAGLGLDLRLLAPNRIFVRGRGLDAELGGQLRLTGTTSNVVPSGQFDLIRGRLEILGKRLTLDEGLVRLQGKFDPYVRFVATSQAGDTTVRIITEGLVSDLQVTFSSQPELPQDEVLAQLLFGRGITNLSPFQAAQLASAVATLAGKGGGGIVASLRKNFGLDDLDVTSTTDGGTAVRAGKYISENVYTDVTVDSTGETRIDLNLDVSPKLTVKGGVTNSGDTSVGIFYQRDY